MNLEHVAAEEGTRLRTVQKLVAPIFKVFGNGCEFKRIWENLSQMKGFDVSYKLIDAPVGLPFMVPHIVGKAVKFPLG